MRSRTRFLVRFSAACFAFLLAGKAWAQYPQGVKSGGTPQASAALATLAIPAVVGVNVAHNFVLDFSSATKCWGTTSSQGTFPQNPVGTTTYTFAVETAAVTPTAPVVCAVAGAQPDVGTIQVLSTFAATSTLTAAIADGGSGVGATTFSALIPDIFSATRLSLNTVDTCKGVKHFPYTLTTVPGSELTAVPTTGWADCKQTLTLSLAAATPVGSGIATGIMTFTMSSP